MTELQVPWITCSSDCPSTRDTLWIYLCGKCGTPCGNAKHPETPMGCDLHVGLSTHDPLQTRKYFRWGSWLSGPFVLIPWPHEIVILKATNEKIMLPCWPAVRRESQRLQNLFCPSRKQSSTTSCMNSFHCQEAHTSWNATSNKIPMWPTQEVMISCYMLILG